MKVKICGIRREEDVKHINKYKPDFVGFVFADSRRRVTPEEAYRLSCIISPSIVRVGVFVNEEIDTIIRCTRRTGLGVVQLHGDESPEYADILRRKLIEPEKMEKKIQVWKGFRVRDESVLDKAKKYSVDCYLLDGFSKVQYGGTGNRFDWGLALKAGQLGNVVIAGGLNPENVVEAVTTAMPYAVDVSSGVESDGKKDENKIKRFIKACRSIERE